MPTTSNFGWTTPADTDLVKDGAAAIRTLGNGIDTSLVDLKGGTTGQVLAKASNTDLDFTWASDATGIPATIFDAKGDLIAASAADTAARLAVGANDTVLTADSSTATGLKWAAPAAGANWSLVNSGGTALTGATTITVSGITGADKLLIQVQGASASANSRIQLRFNSDTANTMNPAGLRIVASSAYSVGSYSGYYEGAVNYVELAALSSNGASTAGGYCLVSGGNSSGVKVFNTAGGATASSGNSQELLSFGGFWDNSATISSVSVISTSGNFDAGSVFVYKSA